ncbi:MAG: serine/threonine protein kinase [Planctomycetes bacterium]|nr:serine/threonine protein kinase [Planctomycetota bacterium]
METPPASPRPSPEPAAATWSRLKELVADALDLPADERPALLATRCQGWPQLLAQAEAMLTTAGAMADFLERPALDLPELAPLAPGTQVGPFVVEQRVGEGGFSEVYRARQREPFERVVALKVLKPGLDSRAVLARFALERRTLARLDHPGLARILDAGALANGRPFVAMEFVDGCTLAEFVAAAPPLATRLDVFLQVCDAVAHAHQRGVIHRDLKPGNVMVARGDRGPQARVIDFGIAKVLAGEPVDGDDRTHAGQLVGTPAYASPEQRSGVVDDVDTRSDVWALGLGLGELASGARLLPGAPWPAAAPRELGWIVARATRDERDERYAGVAELAADVRAFLRGDELRAGPPTRRYRFGKFVRRHRVGLGVAAAVGLALLGGGIAATVGLLRAEAARRDAEVARAEATTTADYLARLLSQVTPGRSGRDVKVVDLLGASEALLRSAEGEPDVGARLHMVVGVAYRELGEYEPAIRHLRAAGDVWTERHGPLDARGLEAGSELASALHRAGRLDEAGALVADLVGRVVQVFGERHARHRLLVDMQAKLAFDRGRPQDAEGPLRALLALDEAESRDDAVATTLGNLAQVLLARDEPTEARALATRGFELATARHGQDSPKSLVAARKLAAVHVHRRDHAAVEVLLGPRLAAARKVFGPAHPETLGIANYLAYALQSRGNLAEAKSLYQELVPLQRQKLARLHPQAVMTAMNYGRLLEASGEFAAAEPVLADAHARFLELRGPSDRDTLNAAWLAAKVIAAQGRHAEVAERYAAAIAAIREHLPADDVLRQEAEAAWREHRDVLASRAGR